MAYFRSNEPYPEEEYTEDAYPEEEETEEDEYGEEIAKESILNTTVDGTMKPYAVSLDFYELADGQFRNITQH